MGGMMGLFGPPNVDKLAAKRDVPGLVKALGYEQDPKIRWRAAGELGGLRDPRAVEPLIAALSDSDTNVRLQTLEALGKCGDLRAAPALIHAMNDSGGRIRQLEGVLAQMDSRAAERLAMEVRDPEAWVREAAAKALGQIGDPSGVGPLVGALRDRRYTADQFGTVAKGVRQTAAEALVKIGQASVQPLVVALTDPETDVPQAASALTKLGWVPSPDQVGATYFVFIRDWAKCAELGSIAVEPLIRALGDPDTAVRGSAVELLGKLGDQRAVAPLVDELERDSANRRAAAKALSQLGDLAVEPLIGVLEKQVSWDACKYAAGVLGELGDQRAIQPLITALQSRDEAACDAAARALGRFGNPTAIEPLIAALDGRTHEAAAYGLRLLGGLAVEPLIRVLTDGDSIARMRAAVILGEIGDSRALEPLVTVLTCPDWHVRRDAAEALGKLGDRHAVESLEALLRDPGAPEGVQTTVAEALARLGAPGAQSEPAYLASTKQWRKCADSGDKGLALLVRVLDDWFQRDEHEAVCRALAETGPSGIDQLLKALNDKKGFVRRAAAQALAARYSSGTMAPKQKSLVLARHDQMIQKHVDQSWECGPGHDDWGIGVRLES